MEQTRVDKWLWTVRITKSRSLATKLCKENRTKVNGMPAKASTFVKVGDKVELKYNGYQFEFLVEGILKSRVSHVLAIQNYNNVTPEEELNKYESWFVGKARNEFRERGDGRPTKKDRREIEKLKDDWVFEINDEYDEES